MRNCEQPVAYYKTYKHQTPDEERKSSETGGERG